MTFTLRYLKGTDKKAFASGAPDLEVDTCKMFGTCIYERLQWVIQAGFLGAAGHAVSLTSAWRSVTGVKLSSLDVKIPSDSKSALFVLL